MRYHVLIGGILICIIIGIIAIFFRSGPASTAAAPATVAGHGGAPPVPFKVDPAEHFQHFARDFTRHLNELPAVRAQHRELDREQERVNNALKQSAEEHKRERARGMSPEESLRKTDKLLRELNVFGDRDPVSSRWAMYKVHWAASYEMDARKTDSILTPFLATITMQGTWHSDEVTKRATCRYRFTFALQGEQWLLRTVSRALPDRDTWQEVGATRPEGAYFEPLRASPAKKP